MCQDSLFYTSTAPLPPSLPPSLSHLLLVRHLLEPDKGLIQLRVCQRLVPQLGETGTERSTP